MLKDLTIVIPTVGEKDLFNTVRKINFHANDAPKKIIIVVHYLNFNKISNKIKEFKNVKILITKKKGQVFQRNEGFKKVTSKYTLQLDADCLISAKDIKRLLFVITKKHSKTSIAPVLYDKDTRLPIHSLDNNKNIIIFLKDLIFGFPIGIKKMGKISKSGSNCGVDPRYTTKEQLECDWLAGGCIMHQTNNLYKRNYFPFNHKAYCEDLIHSVYLKKKGITLLVDTRSKCFTAFPIFPKSITEFKKFLNSYKYFANIKKINFLRKIILITSYKVRFFLKNIIYNL